MAQATPPVPPADDSIPAIPTPPGAPEVPAAPVVLPAPAAEPSVVVTPGIPAAGAVPPVVPSAAAVDAAAGAVPPIPPVGSAPVYAAAPPAKRKIWPWVLGGGILLFILIVVGLFVLVGTILGSLNTSASPSATVLTFDKSFEEVDCSLFKSTTTTEFQASYFPDGFACDKWEDIANSLHDGKTYNYTVDVHKTTVNGSSADVTTTEKDTTPGNQVDYELDYHLVKKAGGWLIDGIADLKG